MNRSIAPVAPAPVNTTACSGPPSTAERTACRACSRSRVIRRPVAEHSVCVLAYQGSTCSRIASSTKCSARPDAAWSA